MASAERRCTMRRDHKPHLWSRTTRKTVTEETAGDTLQCPGRARADQVVDTRPEEIKWDARSARNWAQENNLGPACTCGLLAARGECFRHGKRKAPPGIPRILQPGPFDPGGDGPGGDRPVRV